MPIYMDRHDLPGVTAKDVAEAHQEDLKIQDKYGCRGLTYWFDEIRGIAFCLIEATDKEAVKEMHDHAHGLIPHQILEVNSNLVEAFLGKIEDPEISVDPGDSGRVFTGKTAFRAILACENRSSTLFRIIHGDKRSSEYAIVFNQIIKSSIRDFQGREVENAGKSFLSSFPSVTDAIRCAMNIQEMCRKSFPEENQQPAIGISAGVPITENHDFFEEAVSMARRLCFLAGHESIVVSSEIFNLARDQDISIFRDRSHVQVLSPRDEKFIQQMMDILDKCWNDSNFDVPGFCRKIGLSKSQLNRRITGLTGFSPNDFIKEVRLNRALGMIENRKGNISEIAYESGFTSPSYFSRCFQQRFGIQPSVLLASLT
jgi:AraC-like DNA-binding protein